MSNILGKKRIRVHVIKEASFASTPSPGEYDQRDRRIKEDLRVLGGLVEQIADWADDANYLSAAESVGVARQANEIQRWVVQIKRRLGV